MAIEQHYTVAEAAELLRVSTRTVFNWIYAGTIPAAKVGRKWLIPESIIRKLTDTAKQAEK